MTVRQLKKNVSFNKKKNLTRRDPKWKRNHIVAKSGKNRWELVARRAPVEGKYHWPRGSRQISRPWGPPCWQCQRPVSEGRLLGRVWGKFGCWSRAKHSPSKWNTFPSSPPREKPANGPGRGRCWSWRSSRCGCRWPGDSGSRNKGCSSDGTTKDNDSHIKAYKTKIIYTPKI